MRMRAVQGSRRVSSGHWQSLCLIRNRRVFARLETFHDIGNAAPSQHGHNPRAGTHLAAGRDRLGSLDTNLTGRGAISALGASFSGEALGTAEIVESLSPPGEGGSEKGSRLTFTTAHGVAESSSGSPRSIGGGASS
jgi:hypothetical protein